jgi:PAS domain S-box-containing protein
MPAGKFASSELRLAAIVQSSDDAIVSKDLDGIIRSWNPGAERMFGYTASEAIGRSIHIIVPTDRREEQEEVLRRLRRGESVDHFETIRVRKDGTLIPISLTVSPLRSSTGVVVGASKIARDISDRLSADAALTAARAAQDDLQRRLVALVAASGSLVRSLAIDETISASIALARELVTADGYAMWREVGGQWRVEASYGISSDFASRLVSSARVNALSQPVFSAPFVAADVNQLSMLDEQRDAYRRENVQSMLAVPLVLSGEGRGFIVFYNRTRREFSDVEVETARAFGNLVSAALTTAELYDAQRRSRAHSEFLANAGTLLASSLDYEETLRRVAELAVPHIADWCVVHLVDETGGIERLTIAHEDPGKVEFAQRFQDRYSNEPAHYVINSGQPVLLDQLTDEMLIAGARGPHQLEALRALGLTSFMCVPMMARGRTLGAITLVTAGSRRRYTAEDLQFGVSIATRVALAVENARAYDEARRANRLKDEFLATLSHELRTPLNAILGYARMLKAGLIDSERRTRAFDILDKNASGLSQIVEDVLDVSRIVSGKLRLHLQPVELSSLLAHAIETVRPAADAKGVQIELASSPVPPVAGDPDRLQQVAWNLLSNAVKFTARGGHVRVGIGLVQSQVAITVADNGVGIATEILPHIFERFRQADSRFAREYGGLGLGLAIVRHLVEMHGGTIEALSDGLGKGATFRVVLPVTAVSEQD